MLMSYPELRRDPGPMTTSTPNKQLIKSETTTRGSGTEFSDVQSNGMIENSRSCPTSPVGSSANLSPAPVSEPEVSSSSSVVADCPTAHVEQTFNRTGSNHEVNTLGVSDSDQQKVHIRKSVKRKVTSDTNSLKQRLLRALANMIPHRESLTVRLLVNYTIDDDKSDCLVIDETLCRQSSSQEKRSRLEITANSDSGCFIEDPEHEPKNTCATRPQDGTHILDLSVHSDRDEQELEEAMNTEMEEQTEDDRSDSLTDSPTTMESEISTRAQLASQSNDPSTLIKHLPSGAPAGINPFLIPNIASGQSSVPTVLTTSSLPLVDSSVLALLPLLQQQQQNRPHLLYQTKTVSQAESNFQNPVSVSLPNETAETLLFKEFQALLQGNSNNPLSFPTSVPSSPNINLLNGFAGNKITLTKPVDPVPCLPTTPTLNLINPSMNQTVTSAPSLVSFPLFNAFTPEQLTAVQTLLPSTSLLNTSVASPSSLTSLNLGSASLLNLKDRTTGLGTIGSIQTNSNKSVTQNNANWLSHITVPQATQISLRTLSQLFNVNGDQTTTKQKPPNSGTLFSPSNEGKLTVTLPNVFEGERKSGSSISHAMGTAFIGTNTQSVSTNRTTSVHDTETPQPNDGSTKNSDSDTGENGHLGSISMNGGYNANQLMFGRRLAHTRRFICNQCRKNFASLAELNRHTLEAHTSFKCTICSAHFTQRSNLQRHSLKHVGFKPFTCNLCNKEYYRKDHLVRHIEVTHPNHDPKMNITVHLTSSECLDYLDRINAGRPSSSTENPASQENAAELADGLEFDEGKIEEPARTPCDDTSEEPVAQP